jgi:TfoX/Sxy family transcriptional regulator of competence genes
VIRDFAAVRRAFAGAADVSAGRMFGSEGLKRGGKVFAMEVKGKLVVKISAARAAELRDAGLAGAFDPGHGRAMKQWVAVDPRRASRLARTRAGSVRLRGSVTRDRRANGPE